MKFTSCLCVLAATAGSSSAFTPVATPASRASSITTSYRSSMCSALRASMEPILISDLEDRKKRNNPTPVFLQAMQELVGEDNFKSKFFSAAMVAALALSLTFASPDAAWAARSGGRMGGSFGAAPRMSAPTRSYGGGGGAYYGGGYRGGLTVAPIITPGPFITPFYSPFGYGGAGVMVSRGPSFIDVLLFGGLTLFVLNAFTSMSRGIASSRTSMWTDSTTSVLGRGVTVAKVSIALEVPNRDDPNSILSLLERLAQTARTDSRVGVENLTSQVALELLRRKSSIVSAYTQSNHYNDKTKAQRDFSSTAVKERGKFEQEMVSRYGGVDYANAPRGRSSAGAGQATMAVVTLLIAIDGDSTKLPNVQSIGDVEEALRRIASDVKVDDCLQSAEILWTPEDRSETLSPRDVIADYPELRTV